MERISYLLASVQRCLFPALREEVGELSERERRFVLVLEVVEIEKHVRSHHWLGRTPKDASIIVYCQSAGCSYAEKIAVKLIADGFENVRLFRGGWQEWQAEEENK